jgi:hypothetical protein
MAMKQSMLRFHGRSFMDCFAQPVIGRAYARPSARNGVDDSPPPQFGIT